MYLCRKRSIYTNIYAWEIGTHQEGLYSCQNYVSRNNTYSLTQYNRIKYLYHPCSVNTAKKNNTDFRLAFINIVVVPCLVAYYLCIVLVLDLWHSNLPSVYLNNIYMRLLEHADLFIVLLHLIAIRIVLINLMIVLWNFGCS